ncbi:MAG: family 10 glycosylhydrolase [Vampirovibrionales bacterium]|nr:family 10 glycosylhydrolase [Vampirovibrionales bacterium]
MSAKPAALSSAAQTSSPVLYVFQAADVPAEDLQPLTQVLSESGFAFKLVKMADFKTMQAGVAFVRLGKTLESSELNALVQYTVRGGKLLLLPPEDPTDANVQALFRHVQLPIAGGQNTDESEASSYLSQSLDLKSVALSEPKALQASLPVGSHVLNVKPSSSAKVLAKWGDDFPAIIKTPSATLFNWQWGEELTLQANTIALGEASGLKPNALNNSDKLENTNKTQVQDEKQNALAENMFGFLSPDDPDSLSWIITPSQYEKDSESLSQYQEMVYDAVETALMLDINLTVKPIQQELIHANLSKAEYETFYLQGRFSQAQAAYRRARRHYTDALEMTSVSPRIEGRAIWLDRGTIVDSGSPQGFKKVLEKLKRAGINVLYLETVNAGYSIYPSKITRQNPLVVEANWNPLQVAIEEGHKLGMEVHAWVWCFAVGNKRHNPIVGKDINYPGPILEEQGMMSEALRGQSGNLLPTGKQYEFWLSPASPKARLFLADLYAEIVSQYDVDGLQLDYIRYPFQKPGNTMGYDPVSRARFYQSTNLSLDKLNDQTYRVWVAWKTYQVSSFVKELSERLKAIKPDLKLSAAVFPMPRASRIVAIQQDWETWVENGWIDTLSPMSYTSSPKVAQQTFAAVESATKKHALVYPGIAINKLDSSQMVRQLDALREKGAMGSTIFAMAHLDESKIEALGNGPYKEKQIESPHKNPVHATLMIADDYQHKFDRLLRFQEISNIDEESLHRLERHMTDFQAALNVLKASDAKATLAPEPASPKDIQGGVAEDPMLSLQAAKANLLAFQKESSHWLNQQKQTHPFRYDYFNQLLLKLDQMVDYLSAYYQPKKPDHLQANFMMLMQQEEAKAAASEADADKAQAGNSPSGDSLNQVEVEANPDRLSEEQKEMIKNILN